jgi:hypothetical protein
MKGSGVFLKGGCVFILALLFGVLIFATSNTATETPGALKDVRVFSQSGQWQVVLIGSQSMTYKATKTSNPLRVVIDLPNTLSKPLIISPVGDNEIIDTVKSSTAVHGPPPLTLVEIYPKKEISYDIRQEGEKIRISFDTLLSTPEAEGVETEPAAVEARDDTSPTSTKESPSPVTYQPSPEELKKAAGQARPPASTILAIEPVEMDEDIDVRIIGDGSVDKCELSLLSNPPRLVGDLFGVKSTGVKDEHTLSGPWAKRLRIGRHAKKVRVVFDLCFTPKGELPFQVIAEENRLVVSLFPGQGLPPR